MNTSGSKTVVSFATSDKPAQPISGSGVLVAVGSGVLVGDGVGVGVGSGVKVGIGV